MKCTLNADLPFIVIKKTSSVMSSVSIALQQIASQFTVEINVWCFNTSNNNNNRKSAASECCVVLCWWKGFDVGKLVVFVGVVVVGVVIAQRWNAKMASRERNAGLAGYESCSQRTGSKIRAPYQSSSSHVFNQLTLTRTTLHIYTHSITHTNTHSTQHTHTHTHWVAYKHNAS